MANTKRAPLPSVPADEITRLHCAGLSLLPLGGGKDGKSPICRLAGRDSLTISQILGPMHAKPSACYGVRLGGLAVIDCDITDPDLVAKMEARFGTSPVHVTTPRGTHLYYQAKGTVFPDLRREGLSVDIKGGANAYVMGPLSVRPDCGEYQATKGILGVDSLPEIRLEPERTAPMRKGLIYEGERNRELYHAAIGMVASVDSVDELFGNLVFIRDEECENPATLPDSELRGIAKWAWHKRLEGKIYQGRNGEFPVCRMAKDRLREYPNYSDALALYVILQDFHGHIPGKTFALDHAAMVKAGHTDLSRNRFRAARKTLLDVGLLAVAKEYSAGRFPRTYRLLRVRPNFANVQSLHSR